MQVVILAGGLGKRLKPLTEKVPKPMISINGRPFLEHQLKLLKKFNLTRVILCLGHRAGVVESYFGSGSQWGFDIKYSIEEKLLGTGGALKRAEEYLEDSFLLLNGDTYLPIDYTRLISCFRETNRIGLIVVYDNQKKIAPNNIALDKSNMVIRYNKDASDFVGELYYSSASLVDEANEVQGMSYVDAGALVLKKKVLDLIPEDRVVSLEEEIFPELIRLRELGAYPTKQRYYDIGTPERLLLIKEVLK